MPRKDYVTKQNEIRQNRLNNHLCYDCGKKLSKTNGLTRCKYCLEKQRKRSRKVYWGKKMKKPVGRPPKKRGRGRPPKSKKKNWRQSAKFSKAVSDGVKKHWAEKKTNKCVTTKKEKQIVINIPLVLKRKKGAIVCDNIETMGRIMGTSVFGNYQLYGIVKKKGTFVIPIDSLKKRKEKLLKDKQRIENYLRLVEQIV